MAHVIMLNDDVMDTDFPKAFLTTQHTICEFPITHITSGQLEDYLQAKERNTAATIVITPFIFAREVREHLFDVCDHRAIPVITICVRDLDYSFLMTTHAYKKTAVFWSNIPTQLLPQVAKLLDRTNSS